MRTVLAVTIALALCGPAVAQTNSVPSDLRNMVATYSGVQVVRVIERFDNGAVATVDVMPQGQYRIASTGSPDPQLVVQLATKPAPDMNAPGADYTIKSLGNKTISSVSVTGYSIKNADGSYAESIWFNKQDLPVQADVQTQGHKVSLEFGDYNDSMLIGAR